MEILEFAKMSSKGQITVPAVIRDILDLKKGSSVVFKLTEKGVMFMPCEIKERDTYTREEWGTIERMVAERGRTYRTAKRAKKHLDSL